LIVSVPSSVVEINCCYRTLKDRQGKNVGMMVDMGGNVRHADALGSL